MIAGVRERGTVGFKGELVVGVDWGRVGGEAKVESRRSWDSSKARCGVGLGDSILYLLTCKRDSQRKVWGFRLCHLSRFALKFDVNERD